jgi:hypothetical protein
MQEIIDRFEIPISFSAENILTLVQHEANLVTHPEIARYRTVDDLLGKWGACIILYITREGDTPHSIYGHWCAIFRNTSNGMLTYFDPYGKPIDSTILYMSPKVIQEFGQVPELIHLLERSPSEPIDINKYDMQIRERGVSTCGRHTGLRIQFRHMNNAEYARCMRPFKGLTTDELATLMTCFI